MKQEFEIIPVMEVFHFVFYKWGENKTGECLWFWYYVLYNFDSFPDSHSLDLRVAKDDDEKQEVNQT